MEKQEIYEKTTEVVSKFKNGQLRYQTSPTFNRVVQMLVRGEGNYEIIDQLCQIIDDQNNALEQFVIRDFRPKTITP